VANSSVTVTKVAFNRIPAIARALTRESNIIVQKVATDIHYEVVASFEGPKSGRYYAVPGVRSSRKGGGGRRHRASAPGQAPARMFGLLAASTAIGRSYNQAVIYVGSKYAAHLEYGTSRMAARPFLRPVARKYQAIFNFAIRIMVERATGAR